MNPVYIIDAVRTPRGKGKKRGALAHIHPVDLAAFCLKEIPKRNNLDPEVIEDVILGCVTQVGEQGACIARNAVLASGLPISIPGYTLNRFCGSGLQAIQNAAGMIGSGMMDVIIAGGVESMSRVKMGDDIQGLDLNVGNETLKNNFNLVPQGISADLIATIYNISREEADRFAESSQKKAHKAIQNGYFKNSIIPVPASNGGFVEQDEHPRIENDFNFLSNLPLAFKTIGEKELDAIALKSYPNVKKINHIHTLGNSSGVVDGAGVVLLASEEAVKKYNLKPKAKIIATATAGTEPTLMLTGPVPASQKALQKANLKVEDIDLWEINEAFAAVVIYVMRELKIAEEKVNVNGGAIALGHPLGATGAILLGTLVDELQRTNKKYGLVTLCIGGGMGVATIVEKV